MNEIRHQRMPILNEADAVSAILYLHSHADTMTASMLEVVPNYNRVRMLLDSLSHAGMVEGTGVDGSTAVRYRLTPAGSGVASMLCAIERLYFTDATSL